MANIIRISRHGLKGESNDSAQIVDFEVIASYNWLDEGLPTILVPGIPPLWAPPYVPPAIKKDSGIQFVDQNADRTPGSPLQAMIQAAHTMKPDFDLSKVNIVTDRSPIRKLLGFVSDEKKPFKFGVTIHGNTALITRIEKATRASYSDFGECHGFRVDFETKHTKIANFARASTSHHRIVTYKLGGLIFLVRYAVDAYFGDKASTIMKAKGIENTELGSIVDRIDHTGTQSWSTQAGIEPLAGSLPNDTPVTVLNGGCMIPHEAIMEITTRWRKGFPPFQLQSKLADLWISQTQTFVTGFYEPVGYARGCRVVTFKDSRVKQLDKVVERWESSHVNVLRDLVSVLHQVIRSTKQLGGSCVVSFEGGSDIEVALAKEGEVLELPQDLQTLFLQG